jgi:hypothetical protein
VLIDNTDLVVSRLSDLGLSDVLPEPGPGGVAVGDPSVDDPDEDEPGASEDPEVVDDDESSEPNVEEASEARTSDDGCAIRSPGGGARTAHFWSLATLALMWVRRRRAGRRD